MYSIVGSSIVYNYGFIYFKKMTKLSGNVEQSI